MSGEDIFSYTDAALAAAKAYVAQYAYSKEQSLSAETKELYGLGDNASPDEVLAVIAPKLSVAYDKALVSCRAVRGSYTGTGNNQTISVGFQPKFFICTGVDSSYNIVTCFGVGSLYLLYGPSQRNASYTYRSIGYITSNGAYIDKNGDGSYLLQSGITYYWTAIG